MDTEVNQSDDFKLEFKLRLKRRKALLPWVAVVGLVLISSPKFWGFIDKLLSGVH
jgi:hypothetical protein